MKIDALALDPRATGTAQLLLFQGDADFSARLTLGQIIKGRVLRSYGDQRYALDFDGQRKVVDSAVPLTNGELVHGRVIGLGERVTLQRVRPELGATDGLAPTEPQAIDTGNTGESAIAALFERYQARLDPAQLHVLQRLASMSPAPEQAALAGLVLSKVGLQMTPELVRAVFAALSKRDDEGLFALPAQALALAGARAASDSDAVPALADWLSRAAADIPEARLRDIRGEGRGETRGEAFDADRGADGGAGDGEGSGAGDDLARWILNAQTGGAVAHRVATLPLLLDGELVELDVALFAQTGGDAEREHEPADGIRHRELVFALTTATLGHLEIRARLANGHLRLRIAADSSSTTQWLAEHADELGAGLQRIGWEVDEQRYESRVAGAPNGVLASVVEHLISPGSLSRLV